jgi:hypothetical protein
MKVTRYKFIFLLVAPVVLLTGCFNDLDKFPKYGLNTVSVYQDPANYIHVLAKLYGGLSVTGNQGPAGQPDIRGIDEGFSAYVRVLWNLQQLPTDEAICGWNDPGIPELNFMTWDASSSFVNAMYYRIFYQIPICNEFIRYSSEEWMTEQGFNDADKTRIRIYRAEARFIRALAYYHALDLFGNVPFVTEADLPGRNFPRQILRADLFNYLETELKAIENELPDRAAQEYARANKAVVQTLLAKMYLNAEVYTGTARYTDALTYCDRVISAGYTLDPEYRFLFLADNNQSTEIIFPVTFDGMRTRTYGGTTFLGHASIGGSMVPAEYGFNGGWAGLRAKAPLVDLFPDTTVDSRFIFHNAGQRKEIDDVQLFTDGFAVGKWKNLTRTGAFGSDPQRDFSDIDFPMFRLADIYLMYAEAAVRTGSNLATAVGYFNQIRERAFGNASRNVAALDLDLILAERSRELHWEAHRRTDLIRFGRFTGGTYLWPWKGGARDGAATAERFNLYPLPSADIAANTNLLQNPGF